MKDTTITENILYIGADDKDLDLFESQYVIPNGVSYNSYVILDEKVAVMDTVDARRREEWLANLDKALDGRADFVGERDFETKQAPQRADAERFIYDFLKNGKKPTAELDEAAKAAGISRNTLGRAKTELRKRGLLRSRAEGYRNNKAYYSYLIE